MTTNEVTETADSNETSTTTEALGDSGGGIADALDPGRVGLYAILLAMIAFYLIPLQSGFVTSFKTPTGIAQSLPFAPPLPDQFSLSAWETAFDSLWLGMINSAMYAVPATIISGFLGSIAAYGLTQANWKPKYKAIFLALFVAGVFIPYQAVLVPLTRFWSTYAQFGQLFRLFGLNPDYASLVELIFTHVAYGLPICTLLFRSYYKEMSDEMFESARLDGATLRRVYRRIVLPLSAPMFAVVLIYQFTQIWNDLLFALVLVQTISSDAAPAVLVLSGLGVSQEGTNFALQMAGAFLTALPTIAVYIFFSEEFSEGVAA